MKKTKNVFQCLNYCVYLAYKSCFLDDGSLICVFCNLVFGSSCCTHLSTSQLLLCAQPESAAAKVICLVKTCHVERPQHFRFRRKEEWGVIVFSAVFTQLWWFAHDSHSNQSNYLHKRAGVNTFVWLFKSAVSGF